MPALTWIAAGVLAGWLAARRGKSWRWGFALGFFFSAPGVMMAALPQGNDPRNFCNSKLQSGILRFGRSLVVRVNSVFARHKRGSH
jgi:hypothetical protein